MADWSQLPGDILHRVAETLTVGDLLRFSAVCRPFLSSTADLRRRLRLRSPWLLCSQDQDGSESQGKKNLSSFNFFSLFDGEFLTIQSPKPSTHRYCMGSGEGWLIVSDDLGDLSLLNPITGEHLDLPKIDTLEHVDLGPDSASHGEVCYKIQHSINRALVASNPNRGGDGRDSTVFLTLCIRPMGVAYAKPGDEKWTFMDISRHLHIWDVIFHKDEIFMIMDNGRVVGLKLEEGISMKLEEGISTQPYPTVTVADKKELVELKDRMLEVYNRDILMYLTSSPSADLLRVRMDRVQDSWVVKIHKVELGIDKRNSKLVEVKSLGDQGIFLGANGTVCKSLTDTPWMTGDCVYFANQCVGRDKFGIAGQDKFDIGIYNLKYGSIETILPDMRTKGYPQPSWFVPNFSQNEED